MITHLNSRVAGPDGREYPCRVFPLSDGRFQGSVEIDGVAVIGRPRLTVRDAERSAAEAARPFLHWWAC